MNWANHGHWTQKSKQVLTGHNSWTVGSNEVSIFKFSTFIKWGSHSKVSSKPEMVSMGLLVKLIWNDSYNLDICVVGWMKVKIPIQWMCVCIICVYLLYICLLRENTNVCRCKYMKLILKHILGSNPNLIEGIREHN